MLLLLATAALSVDCAGAQSTRPSDGPSSADQLLKRALARPMARTLQGMTRLDSYVDGAARKADVLIRLAAPDKVQFQALSPTMDLLAVLTTDGQRFVSYERGGRRCYTGKACPSNLARLVPMAMPADQLVAAIVGRPPILPAPERSLHWDEAKKAWRVHLGGARDRDQQDVWITHGDYRFRGSVIYRQSKRVASIAYGGLPKGDAIGAPRRLRLQIPERKIDMSLELREVTVNEAIDARDFAIPCPTGTLEVRLPCEASETATSAGGTP